MFSMVLVAFRAAEKARDSVPPPAGDWSAVRMATAQQGPHESTGQHGPHSPTGWEQQTAPKLPPVALLKTLTSGPDLQLLAQRARDGQHWYFGNALGGCSRTMGRETSDANCKAHPLARHTNGAGACSAATACSPEALERPHLRR